MAKPTRVIDDPFLFSMRELAGQRAA